MTTGTPANMRASLAHDHEKRSRLKIGLNTGQSGRHTDFLSDDCSRCVPEGVPDAVQDIRHPPPSLGRSSVETL